MVRRITRQSVGMDLSPKPRTAPEAGELFLVSIHFPDEPVRMCWARLTGNDPRDFLPEATRFLQSKNLIPGDSRTAFPEASALIQPSLLQISLRIGKMLELCIRFI
jgi:hypothetical protein